MATDTELNVLIRTVADTSGAQAVSQSLEQTQQAGTQLNTQLTTRQSAANSLLRATMAQHQQTLESFQKASESVTKSLGTAPTLRPEDLGISSRAVAAAHAQVQATDQVQQSVRRTTASLVEHSQAQGEVRQRMSLTAGEFARFAVAAVGIGSSLSLASTAGHLVALALQHVLNSAIAADQSVRSLTATFGAGAAEFQRFAQAQSQLRGGFSVEEFQAASESVRPLAEQFGLTTRQMEGLVDAARQLATVRDIPLQTALDAMLGSLQGNAAAAERLGLSMTDQQVGARAAGGAYRQTFDILTDGEKVQLRYIELLKQIDTQQKNAAGSGASLAEKQRELGAQMDVLNKQLGQGPMEALLQIITLLSGGLGTNTDKQRALGVTMDQQGKIVKQTTQDWSDYIAEVYKTQGLPGLPGPTPPPQRFGPAPLQGLETVGPRVQQAASEALQTVRGAIGQLAQATDAQLAVLANRTAELAALNAINAREAMDAAGQVTTAITVALERSQDPAERERLQQMLNLINQLTGANQALLEAQRELNRLQQDGVQLTAQQAAIQLQYLPVQQKIADQERELNRLRLEGQRAALGPSEALEDLRYEEQRARLIAQNRFLPVEERVAARRELRTLARQAPGVELAALEAQRAQTPTERALERLRIQAGLQQNAIDTALAPIQTLITQNQLLSQIAQAVVANRQQQVDVIISGAVDVNVPLGGLPQGTTDQIVGQATQVFAAQFTAALQEAERGRSRRLIGAG